VSWELAIYFVLSSNDICIHYSRFINFRVHTGAGKIEYHFLRFVATVTSVPRTKRHNILAFSLRTSLLARLVFFVFEPSSLFLRVFFSNLCVSGPSIGERIPFYRRPSYSCPGAFVNLLLSRQLFPRVPHVSRIESDDPWPFFVVYDQRDVDKGNTRISKKKKSITIDLKRKPVSLCSLQLFRPHSMPNAWLLNSTICQLQSWPFAYTDHYWSSKFRKLYERWSLFTHCSFCTHIVGNGIRRGRNSVR